MLCAGSSIPVLITGRLLQGLSASVVWTVGLALLSDTVPKDEIGKAMGYMAAAMSVGSLTGPLVGGVIYAKSGYYTVFAVGFGLIGLDVLLRLLMIEKRVARKWLADVPDSAESRSQNSSTRETRSADVLNASPVPSRTRSLPLIITLLLIPRLLAALFGCFTYAVFLASFDSVLPIYIKDIFHWDSTGAGLIFVCLVAPQFGSPFIGTLSDRYGSRVITTTGFLGCVPIWILLRFVTYNSIHQKALLSALLVIIGIFLTMILTPLMAEIDRTIGIEGIKRSGSIGKDGAAAQGFGLFNLAYAVGTLIGPLWAGFIMESANWGTMGWSMAVLSGTCGITTVIWTGSKNMGIRKRRLRAQAWADSTW
ncbi:hypothetical protein IFR05_015765 [Cadophora sp. M221]|nr:hypothetical protein IFR05_015765 [Cadophora sp. M221]